MHKNSIVFWCYIVCIVVLSSIIQASALKKTISFTLARYTNQTGHRVTKLNFDKSSMPDNWRANIHISTEETAGMEMFHLQGTLAVTSKRPIDYEYFPGIGYYKFHTEKAESFDQAATVCLKEGGHLAIINSAGEHDILQTMFARHNKSGLAYIGFHDRIKEGEHVTIFGEPLASAGYTTWSGKGNPDNAGGNENCGSINTIGGINDIRCDASLVFFCEYDLSWTEN